MARHEMEVTIDADGNVTLEAHGIKGKGCLTVLGEMLRALGRADAAPTPTAEMYATTTTTTHKGG